jgi:hypothetical protein
MSQYMKSIPPSFLINAMDTLLTIIPQKPKGNIATLEGVSLPPESYLV